MEIRSEWDLTPIYPSVESEEFAQDLATLKEECGALEKTLAEGGEDLQVIVDAFELAMDRMHNLYAYANAVLTLNTSDPTSVHALGKVEALSVDVTRVMVAFINYLAANVTEVRARSAEGADLAAYAYPFEQLLLEHEHLMSPELEDLASDLLRSGGDAFSRLQQAMGSAISAQWGDEGPKSVVELRNMASNSDREIRRRAYETEIKLFASYEIPFAAALNGVTGTSSTLAKRRKWESTLADSLASSRIDEEILNTLIKAIEDNLPAFQNYLKAKARLLGIDELAFYDLFAPVGESAKAWTYEEAHAFIVKQFGAFSPEMAAFADNAFKAGWIDAFSRPNKVGGAYDTSFPLAKQSRILSNFDDSFGGVSTLAHELGHAWHDSQVLDKPALLNSYPMTLAETASIFSEQLVFQGALAESSAEERVTLVEHFLQDSTQVCVDILSRFYFESAVYARREDGELTAQQFCDLMEDAQKRAYGDGLGIYHRYMWAAKSHYYRPSFSYYNYPYAFGLLFALGLFALAQKEGPAFFDTYTEILAASGSKSVRDVAAIAGIDLADQKFWDDAMGVINSYIDEIVDASTR
ncbi:MAG TPA: M3 family oligoendopeptidase [Sphaerochaeta sp.]|nr:M3 family oligoendopeptidase [Sphaerochaeta sp.]